VAKQSALKQTHQRKGRPAQTSSLRAVARAAMRSNAAQAAEPDPTELERLIHERLRLGIVSALAVNERMTFNELKSALKTSDGNLSVHARKLEEAKYIACAKSFDGRTPKTEYQLTNAGRNALERYLNHMEAIIRKTRES
jgi:DNA-binding HxlR family transcriptional regulator